MSEQKGAEFLSRQFRLDKSSEANLATKKASERDIDLPDNPSSFSKGQRVEAYMKRVQKFLDEPDLDKRQRKVDKAISLSYEML